MVFESPDFDEFCADFLDYDEGMITDIRRALISSQDRNQFNGPN